MLPTSYFTRYVTFYPPAGHHTAPAPQIGKPGSNVTGWPQDFLSLYVDRRSSLRFNESIDINNTITKLQSYFLRVISGSRSSFIRKNHKFSEFLVVVLVWAELILIHRVE